MLFSSRSIWTMVHGVVLGGGALMALAAAVFAMAILLRPEDGADVASPARSGPVAALTVTVAAMLWVTVVTGTYVIFPPYRATPPETVADLARWKSRQIHAAGVFAARSASRRSVSWRASRRCGRCSEAVVDSAWRRSRLHRLPEQRNSGQKGEAVTAGE